MRAVRAAVAAAIVASILVPTVSRGATYNEFTYQRLMVPMRDGVALSVDIWRPVTGRIPVPVILTLTPYHALYKALDRVESDLANPNLFTLDFVKRGYAVALADVRGTYNSGGCWDYGGLAERRDGYDLVEWLGGVMHDGVTPSPAAAWSNGRVAMTGASYDGTTANAAAVEAPPHLATIVPISSISRWYGYAYQQGTRATTSGEDADTDPPGVTPPDFMVGYGVIPPPDHERVDPATEIQTLDRLTPCDRVEQGLHAYDAQPDYDDFWIERDYLRLADRVRVPVLVAHGQLDFNVKTWEGTAWFRALQTPKMLVAGQWPHALPAYSGWNTLLRRWFERWLYDVPNGVENEPPVRAQANAGGFRSQSSWGDAAPTSFVLGGGARVILDDGTLTESEMLRGPASDRFARVAVPQTAGVNLEGRAVLRLRASSDSPGTHFVAVLVDVAPDGAQTVVTRAFMNARYADGLEQGRDLVPGEARMFDLEFIDKDWVVATDHHLEVLIASSSATWVLSDEHRATNTLYLDASTLDLPLRA